MGSLSFTQKNIILSILDAGQSAHSIVSTTGVNASTVSRLHSKEHSKLPKFTGDCLSNLSPTNIHYAIHLISSKKAENAVQITKTLRNTANQPLSASIVYLHLKRTGMKAVVKSNTPFSLLDITMLVYTLCILTWIGLWMTGRGSYGLMRPRSIA